MLGDATTGALLQLSGALLEGPGAGVAGPATTDRQLVGVDRPPKVDVEAAGVGAWRGGCNCRMSASLPRLLVAGADTLESSGVGMRVSTRRMS